MTLLVSVLDASAMLAYTQAEAGGDLVLDALTDPARVCHAHAANMCEVYYDFLRSAGQAAADEAVRIFMEAGVVVREDMDSAFWHLIGAYKVAHRLSFADCFCLALAVRLGGELVTADHEFDPVDAQGVCPFRFIR